MSKSNCKSNKSSVVAARFPNDLISRLQSVVERTSIRRNDLIVAAVAHAIQALESDEDTTAISEMRSPFSHNC